MLVKELIEKLQKQNPESEIVMLEADGHFNDEILNIDNDVGNTVFLIPSTKKDYQILKVGFYRYKDSSNLYQIVKGKSADWSVSGKQTKYVWLEWIPSQKQGVYKKSKKETVPAEIVNLKLFDKVKIQSYKLENNNLIIVSE